MRQAWAPALAITCLLLLPPSLACSLMPHKRSRAETDAWEVGHVARRSGPAVVPTAAPEAALRSIEAVRAVLITLDRTWLRQALLRLRQLATEIEILVG